MQVDSGDHGYEWIEDWATIPDTESGRENGRTHGVEVTRDGRVVVFNQADPAVLVFDEEGTLVDSWGTEFGGAHGLTLVEEDRTEYLWLTDQDSAAVVKTTLDGERVASLDPPDHPAYDDGEFVPTWVAVADDAWVADGYGESLVHRYESGEYCESIDGTDGAGRFDCPHAVAVDRRGEPELYVADRGNQRVQVYDTGGDYRRTLDGELTSPCSFATHGGELYVPELYAALAVFDGDDEPLDRIGENEAVCEREDWPNVPDEHVRPGRFNSPHDAAVDDDGNVYVVEWIVGGRITKLERAD